ncbi:patatin-like phospholipase family protein [Paenibacillus sp. JNUCC31]|uniref:patatin-like phospholipase family protein n=1 Tax=Paenibacillus sp. JNUCC-31 TaxID=2777983 RepID=UPI00177BF4EA|nr:patatin-like phospholipase family protein [Paenibacillus sp. JNUCC-31]QOS78701.1 patatin-like phospholipase family protein [Paenibacillus sp. JNUCC-31]
MTYHFKNLVFEGGGVLGCAYVGVIEGLSDKGILPLISRVGGNSAGSIVALLISLNYSPKEIIKELTELDLKKFADDDWGLIRDTTRFFNKYGWHKGQEMMKWLEEKIKYKTGSKDTTFGQMQLLKKEKNFKDLYVTGTNVNRRFSRTFSHEKDDAMRIADAIRISMSIPLFFEAVEYEEETYVDGGVLLNYPIKMFDRQRFLENKENGVEIGFYEKFQLESISDPFIYNKETLGFRIDSEIQRDIISGVMPPESHHINNIYDFSKNLIGSILDFQQNVSLMDLDYDRTVFIININKVSAINFKISQEEKDILIKSGKESTLKYFQNFENPEIVMLNRP